MIKCPKCKIEDIKQEVNLKGYIFNRRKVITFYCPLCDWQNIKIFKLNEEEYQLELSRMNSVTLMGDNKW